MIRTTLLTTVFAVGLSVPTFAAPPSPGSEDYDQLMPYSGWISARSTNKGGLCCSVSDCRVVQWRMQGASYEAFISNSDDRGFTKFAGAPNRWIGVPDSVIKRESNPTGQAIACWSSCKHDDAGYYCFFLPDMG